MVLRVRGDKRECVWREGKGDRGIEGLKTPNPLPHSQNPQSNSSAFIASSIHSLKHS